MKVWGKNQDLGQPGKLFVSSPRPGAYFFSKWAGQYPNNFFSLVWLVILSLILNIISAPFDDYDGLFL